MSVELLVPIARRSQLYNAQGAPMGMRNMVSGFATTEEDIENMTHGLGGRDVTPEKPIMLVAEDGSTILLIGAGVASAAELQDLAHEALGKANENIRKTGSRFNFEEARERAGLPRSEDFDRLYRDALQERITRHKQNPVSDPHRNVRWPG